MRQILVIISFLFSYFQIQGQDIPKPMIPQRLVNDFTGLLTEDQRNSLESKLVTFDDSTSTQICVVTYDDLQGYSIAEFAVTLGEAWGIGQAGKNNGILILISPANRKMTIQTGYGAEGAIPDAICKRIIETQMAPAFRAGNYYQGIDDATNTLMALIKGEYTADGKSKGSAIPFIVLLIVFFVIFSSIRSRRRMYSPGHNIPWWILMTMMGSSGHSSKGKYGDFRSGSGDFGGFSGGGGGGFGGFGGGSFGGGGASGGW